MEQKVIALYTSTFGTAPDAIEHLFGGGGSSRRYYKITAANGSSVYGVTSTSPDENLSFYRLSQMFANRHLPVPKVYAISDDHLCYLQQNLGTTTLQQYLHSYDCSNPATPNPGIKMLEQVMRDLPRLQFLGAGDDVFSQCYPVPALDEMSVMFDLNYFKYCYVKLTGIEFNEVLLQHDFERLTHDILSENSDTFLYRDFQARNVMVFDGKPCYIDYQGGRRGPIYYDVASFLWQASAHYSPALRDHLIDTYLEALQPYRSLTRTQFEPRLMLFVLFRTLQVLGAYGFRGLWERKAHFIDSIPAGLSNLMSLVNQGTIDAYPYLKQVAISLCTAGKKPNPVNAGTDEISTVSHDSVNNTVVCDEAATAKNAASRNDAKAGKTNPDTLTVQITSFSFKKGIPTDNSGNGGGYVFDCRSTNNPGRYEQYKKLTGLDQPVIDFLEKDGEILTFLDSVYPLVDFHTNRFLNRGFTHLMISFGCTGGQHRSVYCAQHVAEHLHKKYGVRIELTHREQGIHEILG